MGASSSSGEREAALYFPKEDECRKAEQLLACLAPDGGGKIAESSFQGHLRHYFNGGFVSKLFAEMSVIDGEDDGRRSSNGAARPARSITKGQFYRSLSILLKGSVEQQARLMRSLAASESAAGHGHERTASATELRKFVEDVVRAYFIAIEELPEVRSWELDSITADGIAALAAYIVLDLAGKDAAIDGSGATQVRYGDDAISRWLSHCTFFHHMFAYVHQVAFDVLAVVPRATVPHCRSKSWQHGGTLLDLPMLILLNQAIPQQHRSEWRHAYDSRQHGESFTTLVKLIKGRGPTLIIIEDDDGHVFGGFAAETWQLNPSFTGSHQCFLFTLRPQYGIYRPTGLNQNYMYLDVGQETLPNGIGMGGQFSYFGLWLDAEFGRGHSRAKPTCTTYGSPQLSCKPEFTFARMEVWAVGPEPGQESAAEDDEPGIKSILDSDPGAKALLNLIGRAQLSDGMRESDRTAGVPDEHHLYRSPSSDM